MAETEIKEETKKEAGKAEEAALKEETPVVTKHEILLNDGTRLKYTVTTGMMPLKDEKGKIEANVFFMAYTKEGGEEADRPLMFSFNGGPGSSSVWLHLGALGPKRVKMLPDGGLPPPPYRLEDNPNTWLDKTDLVFIDPVGTGYSRAADVETGKKFWSVKGDIEGIGEFVRLYLTRYQRWTSPLFLVGESYGTTRAAGLAGHLIEKGVAFNGILLVSSVLNFQTLSFDKGNDLPYILYLPTYAATAWYHKKLPRDLQRNLPKALQEVEQWAIGDYAAALAKGDMLTPKERVAVGTRLARYTGLSTEFIEQSDLRIEIMRFCKELLRAERRTIGRLDSRFKGLDGAAVADMPEFDPSMTAIRPPYTAAFNHYIRADLGYQTDMEYYILGGGIKSSWDFSGNDYRIGFTDTSDALRQAFAKNPYMQVFIASGYYDLATPYFATEYTVSHLGLDPSLRSHIQTEEYEAGHMMYIHVPSLEKLKSDVGRFLTQVLEPKA